MKRTGSETLDALRALVGDANMQEAISQERARARYTLGVVAAAERIVQRYEVEQLAPA